MMTIQLAEAEQPREITNVLHVNAHTVPGKNGDVHYVEVIRRPVPAIDRREYLVFYPDHGSFRVL